MEKIEELLQKAQNGDEEALKEVIEYYKNDGDEEMVAYFEEKLKKVLETKPTETEVVTDNKVNDDNVKKADTISKGNDIVYENLSVSELKEKINNDPKACKELGERYFKSNQKDKAIELFNSAIEMIKENSEDCDEGDLECLFYCYDDLGRCCEKGTEDKFLNLQNAVEVPCDESLKAIAYYNLHCMYETYKKDSKTGEKYFIKAAEASRPFCLLLAVTYQEKENVVDYKYWLEKAKNMEPNNVFAHKYIPLIIEFKEKNEKGEMGRADYINFVYNCFSEEIVSFYLSSSEKSAIVTNFSLTCQENKDLLSNNDLILFTAVGKLLDHKAASNYGYNKFDFEEINKYYLNCFVKTFMAETSPFQFDINGITYNRIRNGLIDSKNINVLDKLRERDDVKANPKLEKEITADFEEVSSVIKKEQDAILAQEQEEQNKKAQEEKEKKNELMLIASGGLLIFAWLLINLTKVMYSMGFFKVLSYVVLLVLIIKWLKKARNHQASKRARINLNEQAKKNESEQDVFIPKEAFGKERVDPSNLIPIGKIDH